MNVYLGPNQSVMKNAYIGEVYEYSYDFSNKSVALMQADGWDFFDGTSGFSFSSNGISKPSAGMKGIRLPIDLSNARKITCSTTVVVTQSTFDHSFRIADSTLNIGFYSYGSGTKAFILGTETPYSSAMGTGTHILSMDIDLSNKTIKLTYKNSTLYNGTLTDSQVDSVRGLNYLYERMANNVSVKDVYIKVE